MPEEGRKVRDWPTPTTPTEVVFSRSCQLLPKICQEFLESSCSSACPHNKECQVYVDETMCHCVLICVLIDIGASPCLPRF